MMMADTLQETVADRRIVLENAIDESLERAAETFIAKSAGPVRDLRRLEAAAAAARLQRAGDNPAVWWPATVAYAPPTAMTGELERMDEALERDLRQFHMDLAEARALLNARARLQLGVRVASRAPGVTDALYRRHGVRSGAIAIARAKYANETTHRKDSHQLRVEEYEMTKHSVEWLDKNPRLTWVETEIGIGTPAARPEKEAERARMNAQVAVGAPANQPPGYTP